MATCLFWQRRFDVQDRPWPVLSALWEQQRASRLPQSWHWPVFTKHRSEHLQDTRGSMNFDYDKIYTAGWKDAMEEMQEKLKKEQEYTEQCQTMVLMLLEKLKEKDAKLLWNVQKATTGCQDFLSLPHLGHSDDRCPIFLKKCLTFPTSLLWSDHWVSDSQPKRDWPWQQETRSSQSTATQTDNCLMWQKSKESLPQKTSQHSGKPQGDSQEWPFSQKIFKKVLDISSRCAMIWS